MYDEYIDLATWIRGLDLGDYLEFGCGGGGFLRYVLDQNPSFTSITAVDINSASVEKAKLTLEDYPVKFIVDKKLPLALKANQFSTITISNTLHHLREKDAVFDELKRLVKPSGKIVITEMMSDDISEAEQTYCRYHAFKAEVDRSQGIYHDTTYTSEAIETIVLNAGLRIINKQTILNNKVDKVDAIEVRRIEASIDDILQEESGSTEIQRLSDQARSIKAHLRKYGIKRPRQIFLETTLG